MQLALRPYVTTGIALVGASVIAMSPISPVTPDIHVPSISTSSVAVQLTGAVNPTGDPFSAWLNTAVNAVQNTVTLGGQVLGNGAPILTQVLVNQIGYLNQIGTAFKLTITYLSTWQRDTQWLRDYAGVLFKQGQIGEAFNWAIVYPMSSVLLALYPMINLMSLPGQISRNITNVLESLPLVVQGLGSGAMGAVMAPFTAFGTQLQAIADSVTAGDPLAAVNAVLNIPAVMTNAFFSSVLAPNSGGGFYGGILGTLLVAIPNFIADLIKPPAPPVAPAAVESAPDTLVADVSGIASTASSAIGGAGTITLSPATETPAAETPAAETPVEETPAAETPVVETPAAETPVVETPAAETPVVETPVDETPVVVDVEPVVDTEPIVDTEPTTLVRDSVQAKPGQLGLTKASEAGANLAKSVRGEISKVANKIDEGIKKAFGKPAKKAAAESNAGSSNTGADSGSGSGSNE